MKQSVIQNGSKTVYVMDFNTISEMVGHNGAAAINTSVFYRLTSNGGNKSWAGTANYKEAQELLINGWDEGAKKLTSTLKIENAKNAKEVSRAIFDIVGFQCSVPRYLQGVPQSMINKKTVKQKQKVITLYKSICYDAGVSSKQILDDSVKFIQIVQEIEKQGIRVNVYTMFHATRGNEQMAMRVKIKSSGERLNISKMSFPLMHPSMLRRIIFRTMETEQRVKGQWCPGYGVPTSTHEVKLMMKPNEHYIPVLISEKEALNIVAGVTTK